MYNVSRTFWSLRKYTLLSFEKDQRLRESDFKSNNQKFRDTVKKHSYTATGQVMGRDGSWWEEGRVWTQTREDFSFRGGETDRAGRQGLDISKTYYHKQDTWCQHNYLNVCPEIAPYHWYIASASPDPGYTNIIDIEIIHFWNNWTNSFAKQCKVFLPSWPVNFKLQIHQ